MDASGLLVLPVDVAVVPVAQLSPGVRNQIGHQPGDYCVTRPRTRVTTSVIDGGTAALLERFREPTTIVDAVIAFSAAAGREPRQALDEAFPLLAGFIRDGLLLPADSALARPVECSLVPGEVVGGAEIVEPVQVLLDTDVYLTRLADGSPAALKIAREGAQAHIAPLLEHEAAMLRELDGRHTPVVLGSGEHAGRAFLLTSWAPGVDAVEAAADARRLGGAEGAAVLLSLAEQIAAAYAHLHRQGVLHGDVHPRNVLVGPDQHVVLVDFGFAARKRESWGGAPAQRAGVDFFLEPEFADARLLGQAGRAATPAGEQYSVAALLYLVLTGAHTHTFSLETSQMLRQLRDAPPLPFSAHAGPGLPATERTLRRALAKAPDRRYQSLAHLLRSLRRAAASDRPATASTTPARRVPEPSRRLLNGVLARLTAPGPLFDGGLAPPTASIWNGGAGFAYTLLRFAHNRGDERLLALADLWSERAARASAAAAGFISEELGIVPRITGENSLYHRVSGVHCVQALIAQARGDEWSRDAALDAFLQAAAAPNPELDVTFGRSGLLLGCALLVEACSGTSRDGALRALGAAIHDSLWSDLCAAAPIEEDGRLRTLGAAHGWAGYLFAVLRWAQATATALPEGLPDRLDQLGALARPAGRGLLWPFEARGPRPDNLMGASWCNGAAGQVHLWRLAGTLTGEPRYRHWGDGAAWGAYEGTFDAPGEVCCGLAGRSYALLSQYAVTGDGKWLARARVLADRAATNVLAKSLRPDSLYKGEIGTALLVGELDTPEFARMPLYDGEGWPVR
jgi:serine/threonine-protein kinase